MRFDWRRFCTERGINFETAGKNVVRGNISIHCPWCGSADKSGHMGLSLDVHAPVWGCLRDAGHRGRDPARLVAKLLRISLQLAQALVQGEGVNVDEFDAAVDALRSIEDAQPAPRKSKRLDMPEEFRRLDDGGHYSMRFLRYLADSRKFGWKDTERIAELYDLRYAISGPMAWRLIFPIRDAGGKLIGWTGREIRTGAKLRYMTSAALPDDALIGREDVPGDAGTLVCEGPLDWLKLDYYGGPLGFRALGLMGKGPSRARIASVALVACSSPMFMVLDQDALADGLEMAAETGAKWVYLKGGKDPGEMSGIQVKTFLRNPIDFGIPLAQSPI